MDKTKLAWIGALVAAITPLVTLLAANGEAVLAVLGGVPKVLAAWSSGLPLGTGSWITALVLGSLLWLFLLPRLPRARDGSNPHMMTDNIVIGVVAFLVLIQQLFTSTGSGQMLRALMMGGIAGFLSTYLGRLARSIHITTKKPPECGP